MSAAVACAECHVVPAAVHDASHRDGDNTAEIIFGALATTNGASPSYNYGTRRCSNTYCHDGRNFKYGFSAGTDPVWNDTSYITGAVADCSKCHGYPPGNGHPRNSGCGSYNDGNGCHTNVNTDDTTFKNASLHVNGTVEVIGLPCRVCHGSTVNDAPPNDLNGDTSAADPEVGAHQAHLTAPSNYSSKIACAECHIVPEFGHVDDPTHIDGDVRAEVTFGAISKNNAAAPAYDYTLRKCSNTYCHDGGRFEHGWSTGTDPVWNDADYLNGTVADCSRCHGYPPGGGHANRADCNACHLHVNPDNRSFGDKTKHINGTVEAN
jgi:predicted CxxxxCH...CXXCH cytochrome family protein